VIDPEIFRTNAAFLSTDAVQTHLGNFKLSIEAVLASLRAGEAVAPVRRDLVEAVHALAGTAGTFGFVRLSETARRFTREARQGFVDPALSADFRAALEESLREMRQCARAEASAPA
jgi:HPt (histidine-containing phosphotransfer) domain-containing protein